MKKTMERLLSLVLALLMLCSCFSVAEDAQAAERTEADYVFTDYDHSYHLVSFLNGYNVLAFGNAHSVLHMMGAILVQGVYSGDNSNSGFADGEDLPPSYVQGMINAPNSVYNSRNHSDVAPLYVGSANTVETWEQNGVTYYSVNGVGTGNNSTTPVYVSDNFFNFDEAYEVIKADQATMAARGRVVTPVNGVITVNVGDNVIIQSLEGVSAINIIGDPTDDVNTTINILDSGSVNVPRELFNGSQPAVREQNDAGTAVVFNFPNADVVKLPTQNWVGHVIAPDADVSQDSGNFNGCIICDDLYTGAEGHIYSYNTEDTSWDTVFSLEKVWNDGDDADGIRPDYIEVQLLANGQPYGSVVRLTEQDDWYHVWPTLPEFDADGERIVYSVREVNVPEGYTSEYQASTQTLINTHNYEEIDIRGTKTWAGESSFGSRMRPMYLTVYLYADGVEIDSQTIVVTDEATQSYAFEDLPKYKGGVEIVYTVHEETVPGYIGTSSGYDLTNTWGVESIEISGTKTWNDADDADGLRPTSVTIQLLADGEVIEEHVATAAQGWTYTFTNLPKTDQNGKAITYTVREKATPEGYTATVDGYDIVNTHEQETVDLSGAKTWNDDNNNDGLRPEAITVILLANQAEVARKTVTAEDGWAWEFNDMPKNYGGKEIHYTVAEEPVEGYTTVGSGMNLTNTHENETIDISGDKTWVDNDDNDGLRPESITISLLQDGKAYDSVTVTEADGWAWSFTDLPKYTDGHEHVYTITEEAVEGYTAKVDGYDVTNTHEAETVDVLGHKVWDDDDNNDGVRPTRLTVYLLADGERTGKYRTTTAEKNWYWVFEDLPKYKDGVEIVYSFEEEAVAGYTGPATVQMTKLPAGYGDVGYELTNTHENETVEISGAKTWSDENNQDGKRPASITIRLWKTVAATATTEAVHEQVAVKTVTAADGWAWDFGEQPKYENGQEIIYTVTEDPVTDYSTTIDGYDVENTYTPGKVNISGVKYWNDGNDQDGLRPASITVRLWKTVGGKTEQVDVKTVTEQDGWAWSFTDLDEYEDGTKIVYTITEDEVEGYESIVDQYDLINNHVPETIEISGAKTWADDDNQDGLRPERITIRLWATVNGETTEVRNAAVTVSNGWKWHFVGLPKYEAGEEIVYTITEDAVAGYETVISGYNATNTHESETTSVSGSKTWNDADNQDGKRPASITINLLANGAKIDSVTVTEEDGWAWSFTDLPKYEAGKEIVYTITEDAVAGYETVISGYNVTNSYEPETTEVNGYKVWKDDGNRDGKRPASIEIRLLANGKVVDTATVTAGNGWMWSFTELPRYENGAEIVYAVEEVAVSGYTAEVDGYVVTNTYEIETVDVSGSKTWNDADNQDGKRPESITINLLANGAKIDSVTVTEEDGWAWSFTDLPKYEAGEEIVYTITEDAVEGYETIISGYNVTNTYETETTSVSGSKTWNDADNQDGKRPESITINLLANGEKIDSVTVTEEDGWAWSFTDLPKYEAGEEIVYTITEDAVEGYETIISGYNVTNSYETETTSVSGSKTWNDADNQDGKRPESITIRLWGNGIEIDSVTVTEEDGWAWSFTGLPKYVGGKLISYTITEDAVPEYTATVVGYDVTNSYEPTTTVVSGQKYWFGDEDAPEVRPESITIRLLANGVEVDAKTVTADNGWEWAFIDLPLNEDGVAIEYTITEDAVPDYISTIIGYDAYNTYDRTSFSITKVWDGAEGGSITLTLYADGERMNPQPSYEQYGQMYIWEDLPLYNEEGEEIVYSATEKYMNGYMTIYSNVGEYAGESDQVYDSGTIINRAVVSVYVRKVWADLGEDEEAPAIQLTLYCNGVPTDKPMPEPDKYGWYKYYNLPATVNGMPAHYTVREEPMDGYMAIYTTENGTEVDEAADGMTITNVRIPATGDGTPLLLWTALLTLSGAALVVLVRRRRA